MLTPFLLTLANTRVPAYIEMVNKKGVALELLLHPARLRAACTV